MKSFICILLFIFVFFNSFAQTKGCLTGTTVHTSVDDLGLINVLLVSIFGGTAAYKNSPSEPQVSACVNSSQTKWITPSGACRVCPSGYNILTSTGCSGTSLEGLLVTKSVVYCNIDDYTLPLTAAAGILGLLVIKRRKII